MKISSKDSVSIILLSSDNKLLLQHRDNISGIEYPDYYSFVAGWIEKDETPLIAIKREIQEEIFVLDNTILNISDIVFLGEFKWEDRSWTEYVFYAKIYNSFNTLGINEGQGLAYFTLDECLQLKKIAPNHKKQLVDYKEIIFNKNKVLENGIEVSIMVKSVKDYIKITQLGLQKDYEALEIGDGYILPSPVHPTGVLHTNEDAKIIALLIFAQDKPRGDHYHRIKIEYITILNGKLKCSFFLPESPTETEEIILEAGQQARILPGCAHIYTAIDGDVYALEYAPQRYKSSDVYDVERN